MQQTRRHARPLSSHAHLVGLVHRRGAGGQGRGEVAGHPARPKLVGLVGLEELEGAAGHDLDRGRVHGLQGRGEGEGPHTPAVTHAAPGSYCAARTSLSSVPRRGPLVEAFTLRKSLGGMVWCC